MPDLNSNGKLRWTNKNLIEVASPILAKWLIAAAYARTDLTYGNAMERLKREHDFGPNSRATRVGFPGGILMNKLKEVDADVPLLNSLLVLQSDRMPSTGIGGYFADWGQDEKFRKESARDKYWEEWKEYSEDAIQEVYDFDDWEAIYERAFDRKYVADKIAKKRKSGKDGNEKDGIPRGRGGEGKNHKALRLWVTENPKRLAPRLKGVRAETEEELLSGDRVDSVYYADGQTLAIEVKSSTSNWYDLQRGIYQCVKYQAVMQAMDPREDAIVNALLVTEEPLDGTLKALAKQLGVRHKLVSPDRKTIK